MPDPNTTLTPHRKSTRLLYFWAGIFATLVYRSIIVWDHIDGPWVKIAWYVGTVGFVIYFAHRFSISERRAKVIVEHQLLEKIDQGPWSPEDQTALRYVLGTLRSSKERWNYIVIFISSALALLIGLWLDFFS